ncbi:MAG: hypothetical protein RBG13Loki_0905 [Promethearchaeota archaeon CR_4]|nr:MAG: hypothetical protein RBG13Loki_0905 [Candidatus Lokiarchaeota archaeon CR_4]
MGKIRRPHQFFELGVDRPDLFLELHKPVDHCSLAHDGVPPEGLPQVTQDVRVG